MSDNKWIDQLNHDEDLLGGEALDALLRETKEELERDEIITDDSLLEQEPVQENFQVEIPEAYADLSLEEDEEEEEGEQTPRRTMAPWLKMVIYVLSVLAASALLAVVAWECADEVLSLTKPDKEVEVSIPENFTIDEVSQILYDHDMIEMPWLFKLYCWFANAESKIDPGTFQLNQYYDYYALVNGMVEGVGVRATTTVIIPEGYEAAQIFQILEDEGVCSVQDLEQAAVNYDFDYEFLKEIPLYTRNRLEGYLFPDTYEFYVDDNPTRVLAKFLDNFDRKFDDTMEASLESLNAYLAGHMADAGFSETEIADAQMGIDEVIVVASLIEKETASSSESATISSVIYNRLASKDYPLLQIDATVQYALEERKELLTSADLAIDSPYNTYRYPGLPVGPIANPGLLSIQAALNPEDTDFYFYALNLDGSHHFSETYHEHNQFLQELEDKE